ncbi:MAG TPA: glycosyltransferase family 2 protein [Phycisphaerales bacterium]|nr:glycosyltransferase family 2 protein [Phycisphaerales bacterium]
MRLSVAIMCKNNEQTIGRTLGSVEDLADEIVAVDSGSTDGTIAMLEQAGARVVSTEWLGYRGTRQKSIDEALGDWVLVLDSDESVLPELAASIAETLDNPRERTGFEVNRKVFYRDCPLNFAWQPEWRLRLFRRGRYHVEGLDPHDYIAPIDPAEPIGRLSGDLRHDSIGQWSEFLSKQGRHARMMAESMHNAGRAGSRLRLVTSPPGTFIKQLVLKQAWRDGTPGWLAASSMAIGTMMKHAALLEIGMERSPESPSSTSPSTQPPTMPRQR